MPEATGYYTLAWQKDERALFVEIFLSVELRMDGELNLELPKNITHSWAVGIQFGIEVFRDSVLGNKGVRSGFRVRVEKILGQSVDTTPTAVAFAVFQALSQALELKGEQYFQFDSNTGTFSIK
jgi:hypothetical protein